MPTTTTNLNLYKYNSATDGNSTFNIDVALNENWDKIDADSKNKLNSIQVLTSHLGEMATKKAEFKNGSNTFPSGQTTFTVTDTFITANTLVTIIPKGEKQGAWSAVSNNGNFVITSDTLEISTVPFDWGGVK